MQSCLLVEEVLRDMPGGAQTQLARCSDGAPYVVKCPGNPQGPNVLANEFIGASLLGAIGLPTGEWKFARYSPAHKCSFVYKHGTRVLGPKCGLHFASRMLEPSSEGRLYSYLPDRFIGRLKNRPDFLGALVFDIFTGSLDARQAVYVEDHRSRTFKAVFIDNGHICGGPCWDFSVSGKSPRCLQRTIYSEAIDLAGVEGWIARIEATIPDLLPSVLGAVPKQWYKGDIACLQDTLCSRAASLRSVVWDEILLSKHPTHLSMGGVHDRSTRAGIYSSRAG
jgi:hypothetical protein